MLRRFRAVNRGAADWNAPMRLLSCRIAVPISAAGKLQRASGTTPTGRPPHIVTAPDTITTVISNPQRMKTVPVHLRAAFGWNPADFTSQPNCLPTHRPIDWNRSTIVTAMSTAGGARSMTRRRHDQLTALAWAIAANLDGPTVYLDQSATGLGRSPDYLARVPTFRPVMHLRPP